MSALPKIGKPRHPAQEQPRRRLRTCVENWPDCYEGGYDPRCCRFPKTCSCDVYDPERVTDADLESAQEQPWFRQLSGTFMRVCAYCGDKRCPHANDLAIPCVNNPAQEQQ